MLTAARDAVSLAHPGFETLDVFEHVPPVRLSGDWRRQVNQLVLLPFLHLSSSSRRRRWIVARDSVNAVG
jgi:hypothetical protein